MCPLRYALGICNPFHARYSFVLFPHSRHQVPSMTKRKYYALLCLTTTLLSSPLPLELIHVLSRTAPIEAPEQAPASDYLVQPRDRKGIGEKCTTRVRMTALHPRFVEVQPLNNLKNHCIPRTVFYFHPYRSSWMVNRKQFHLKLACTTTFNGCQGLLSCTALDPRTSPFAHSQLYTVLSGVCLFSGANREKYCVTKI